MGLDRGLPASGLAVYHCDILGSNELQQGTAAKHYQCALLQADGRRDLELDANRGDGNDLYGAIQGIALSAASIAQFARVGRPRVGAGDLRYFARRARSSRSRSAAARRRRRGRLRQATPPMLIDSRQQGGRRFEHDRHRQVGNRRADQGEGRHPASPYRRSQGSPDLADRPQHRAASATWRIRRQSGRDL